jgi:hypothetical protein
MTVSFREIYEQYASFDPSGNVLGDRSGCSDADARLVTSGIVFGARGKEQSAVV